MQQQFSRHWISCNEGQWPLSDGKPSKFCESLREFLACGTRNRNLGKTWQVPWIKKMIFELRRPRLSSRNRIPGKRNLHKERTPETCRGSPLSIQQSNDQCLHVNDSLAGKELPERMREKNTWIPGTPAEWKTVSILTSQTGKPQNLLALSRALEKSYLSNRE